MLPAPARLRRREDFTRTVRGGRRAGRGTVVIHAAQRQDGDGPRIGFVVSKSVGNSVGRHRLARQLRHVFVDRLASLPADHDLVVRALPAAAGKTASRLAADVDLALAKLLRTRPPGHGDA